MIQISVDVEEKMSMTFEDIEERLKEMLRLIPEPLLPRKMRVSRRLDNLCQNFPSYLDSFERKCPFKQEQLRLHVKTINLRYELGNVGAALRNKDFIAVCWRTIKEWLERGAHLLFPLEKFRETLLKNEDEILKWEGKRIDDKDLLTEEVAEGLWKLIDKVRVSEAYNPIVSGSKTFHHLLPELVPPMDWTYTMRFFMFHEPEFEYNQQEVFTCIWKKMAIIASKVNLRHYVGKTVWNTSITKVIDNAIIGYFQV